MSTLLIKNARYIVSCDDTDRLYERSNLFIRDNAIEYIGPGLRQAVQGIDERRTSSIPITTYTSSFPAICPRCSGWSSFPGW